ncbi:MAG TPA: alpha-1,4-glucan--maltose-1-phosphate maltosyltransferase [Gaiellaceae bacterium]|nr:alpha-1,4-glucan--maltose-1-phosphate maltosyltransferase [Gaiellaceae bacterium]
MAAPRTKRPPPRIQIQDVAPQVDCGRYPVKRTVGDRVDVRARIFRDGHETLGAAVRWKPRGSTRWAESPLQPVGNDWWEGSFAVDAVGEWCFRIEAWVDRVASWQVEVRRKSDAGQADLTSELAEGALLLGRDSVTLQDGLAALAGDRSEKMWSQTLGVDVDRVRARFGAWYELFPRSWGGFAGVETVLPELADLGFDVVYLPPIHPIGLTNRKGKNNAEQAEEGDVGSPWAIGGADGGHTGIHSELGTVKEFERLVARGRELGCEICIDYAINASADHPWLTEHPEWFHRRPDGTLKYAENPPKRYQDIYNLNFDTDDWHGLWNALRDIVLYWVARGVRCFRVDNPHTKPVPFWEWLIKEVRQVEPEVIFLSEAFTRPAMMTTLGKVGFSQSYTYFTWKNTRWELTDFLREIAGWNAFYRPNFFANTPDILHEYLQTGGRPAFEARLVLAATLSPSYGIYSGFESLEATPAREGSEEYLNSEKYELRERALDGVLLPLVARLNEIRRENPALQRFENLELLETESEYLFAFAKRWDGNTVLVVTNLDPTAAREGLCLVPASLGLPPSFAGEELLTGTPFQWGIGRNFVRLGPGQSHVVRVDR